MLLSLFVSNNWISAVVLDVDPFSVINRAFIKHTYSADPFFNTMDSTRLKDILCHNLEISPIEFDSADKIAVFNGQIKDIEHWQTYSFQQILTSLGDRVLFINFDNAFEAFKNEPELLNRYANFVAYNEDFDSKVVDKITRYRIRQHFQNSINPKAHLQEFIVTFEDLDDDIERKIRPLVVEEFANICDINHIFEFTYDYGCFMIPTLAALIHSKTDPVSFFKTNPIHIDQKLVVIPNTEDKLDLYIDEKKPEEKHDLKKITKFKINEKQTLTIKLDDPKNKVDLEVLGCSNGVYLDARSKQDD
ncbi:MAG: hypothetical protein QG570_59 [Patescibacteria group bacterium]|nr:hypothetical protein [Patescibacteria group bacterium]